MKEKNKPVYKLTLCAIMVALNTVLSLVKFWEMPLGGSVTLLSMLPVAFAAIMYGTGAGLLTGFISSVIQLALAIPEILSWALTPQMLVAVILLDYLLPFTVIGLAGVFRRRGGVANVLGVAFALTLRFLCHFASGVFLWTNLEKFIVFGKEWINHPVLYSICYNGQFMLPEIIITTVAAAFIFRSSAVKKLIGEQ